VARVPSLFAPLTLPRRTRLDPVRPDLRTRYLIVLVLAALATGIGSTWAVLGEKPPVGAVRLGPWQTFPRLGSADIDPYGRAILARGPHLPLAAGEGIQLSAATDSTGSSLSGSCRYRISGATLPSRGWTLVVANGASKPLTGADAAGLTDADIVTDESGKLTITASPAVSSGNWLRLPKQTRFELILRFYDTPVSSGISQLDPAALPRIDKLACEG
jgi:hypothetical protein